MMDQTAVQEALAKVRAHRSAVDQAANAIKQGIASLPTEGLTNEYKEKKTQEVRARFIPSILAALSETTKINDQLRGTQAFYENTPFLMSLEPVSKRLNNAPAAPAENQVHEAQTRHALLAEYAKMPNALLQAAADHAKAAGNYGHLHLASIENASRDQKDPSWKQISLDGLELPHQKEALNAIREAKAHQLFLENIWREAEGRKVDPSSAITAQRMMNEVAA
ncbi:MAG: hypothetical protein WC256_13980 [Desulfurivibrionaceae bacterium]|jgi:hypothetical protein